MNYTNNPECEQSWCLENGTLIVDPSDPQRLIDLGISVSSDRLVTSLCVNLNYQIICHSADGLHFSREIMFRVRNETTVTPNSDDPNEVTPDLQRSDQWWWISALPIVIFLVLISFLLRKRIFRCFQREDCQHEASNIWDLVTTI
ncbi:hypothetical protein Q8A67_001504 [Cirrhinus molitorella]|uniref:Uncharacterized protein n=1 Tax=Cirrhinus molitorella TaxID=172907 RepID=A0AA88QHV5_9TELE|nr:hypothetical protein Q8A67_001504 [Cirrhinus molitorella]